MRTGISLLIISATLALAPRSAQAASVVLRWTAPGDDSIAGRATAYDLRYSSNDITAANFLLATPVTGLPMPSPSGSQEQFTVGGLSTGVAYFFAIRSRDEANNWSQISNVVFTAGHTTGVDPNAPTLSFSESRPNPARGRASFSYSLIRAARIDAFVSDIAGRRVRALASGVQPAGLGQLSWDLTSDAGAHVAPGVYVVRARLDGTEFTRRVVVER